MDWKLILTRERALHPGMIEADAVKLFHQALRGGDHLMGDLERYISQLAAEWDNLPDRADPEPPMIQVISPTADMARFHLLPARNRGMSIRSVTELLLAGGLARTPESEVKSALPDFLKAARDAGFRRKALLESFGKSYHHSSGYGFASYRVISLRSSF
jgi:hypothetical protein